MKSIIASVVLHTDNGAVMVFAGPVEGFELNAPVVPAECIPGDTMTRWERADPDIRTLIITYDDAKATIQWLEAKKPKKAKVTRGKDR